MEGDTGKAICKEAERLKPAAVVMGTRGRGIIQRFILPPSLPPSFPPSLSLSLALSLSHCCWIFSVLQGSVSEYCFHNCKSAPVIIVPGKGIISHNKIL